jgi:hypothetical protein
MPVQGICAVNLASHSQATRACCDWGLLVSRATMCLEALKQGFAAMSTNQDESASVITVCAFVIQITLTDALRC